MKRINIQLSKVKMWKLVNNKETKKETNKTKITSNLYNFFNIHRCEVRPGPEFLIRRYKFHHDNSFSFHQFFYTDHLCTDPAYTYKIKGTIEPLSEFLMLEGATEATYILNKVTLMVYKDHYARKLSQLLNDSCQGNHFSNVMELYKKYTVFDWTRDDLFGDCIEGVAFTMHELQVLRHEFHTEFNKRTSEFVSWEELFLGDIHTGDNQQKIYHRPKTYQIPLRKYQVCSTDTSLSKSDRTFVQGKWTIFGPNCENGVLLWTNRQIIIYICYNKTVKISCSKKLKWINFVIKHLTLSTWAIFVRTELFYCEWWILNKRFIFCSQ